MLSPLWNRGRTADRWLETLSCRSSRNSINGNGGQYILSSSRNLLEGWWPGAAFLLCGKAGSLLGLEQGRELREMDCGREGQGHLNSVLLERSH